jgi:hypothetical protein
MQIEGMPPCTPRVRRSARGRILLRSPPPSIFFIASKTRRNDETTKMYTITRREQLSPEFKSNQNCRRVDQISAHNHAMGVAPFSRRSNFICSARFPTSLDATRTNRHFKRVRMLASHLDVSNSSRQTMAVFLQRSRCTSFIARHLDMSTLPLCVRRSGLTVVSPGRSFPSWAR